MSHVHIPVIAIDGLTASGKSSVAEKVAYELGFHLLSCGALFRFAAYLTLTKLGGIIDETEIRLLLRDKKPVFQGGRVFLGSSDITNDLYGQECTAITPAVAQLGGLRQDMLEHERSFARRPGLVAEGRVTTSVVFPEATFKVFVSAPLETRARWRYAQLERSGRLTLSFDDLKKGIATRDDADLTRLVHPVSIGEDVFIVDAHTHPNPDSVAGLIVLTFRNAVGQPILYHE